MSHRLHISCKKHKPVLKCQHVTVWNVDYKRGVVTYSGHKDSARIQAKLYVMPSNGMPYFKAFNRRMYLYDFTKAK